MSQQQDAEQQQTEPLSQNVTRRQFVQSAALGLSLSPIWSALAQAAQARHSNNTASSDPARSSVQGRTFSLSNHSITAVWQISGGKFKAVRINDRLSGKTMPMPESAFAITLKDGRVINASELKVIGTPRAERLKAEPRSPRLSDHFTGQQFTLTLEDKDGRFSALWRGILRDGSNYIRQEVTLRAGREDLPLSELCLIDLNASSAQVSGTVKGSPVVAANMFFGFEHPLSTSKVEGERVRCFLTRELPLKAGQKMIGTSVIGVTHSGQLRRDFLNYIERERAHPYRPFLHYNSWYDLGYFTKFDEAGALSVIETYGTELVKKRNVVLSSFLFDDGWDDPTTLWKFHSGFPSGFTPLKQATAKYNTHPGVWLSPWGGYGKPKEERLKFGQQAGFETNRGGFALSGPTYYRRFRETCLEMIRQYGINQFKIDGTGNANSVIPGSEFGSDFEAAITLIADLRAEKPDLYVNLTTGTYPSPFWLWHADSTWRGGEDHSFAGVGSDRQKWITYRDAQTFKNVVKRGPLYPINSLMLHGLIFAQHAKNLTTDLQDDFSHEIRSYFGTGTQLQEMYVTPSLLSSKHWDTLAEAANWSRQNASVLVDTHWIGGDPANLEAYGWASWSARKGIITLRNPNDKAQSFSLDVQSAFELPTNVASRYEAHSPWAQDRGQASIELRAGQAHAFQLKPFEVLTLEALPK